MRSRWKGLVWAACGVLVWAPGMLAAEAKGAGAGSAVATRPAATVGPESALVRLFDNWDRNRDGFVTPDELNQPKMFKRLDRNGDGRISKEELGKSVRIKQKSGAGQQLPTPTKKDVRYGPDPRNVLDFWQAKSDRPTPLVVFIHGGGFRIGDKSQASPADLRRVLAAGASFMSINYRFLEPTPLQDILRDCGRAIQYVRLHAEELNIDPKRIASYGGSAGAGASLWLAVHDDLADAKAADAVLRQSSRLSAAGCLNGQATYDLVEWQELVYPIKPEWWRDSAERWKFYGFESEEELNTEGGRKIRADCSMYGLLSADDPPIVLSCNQPADEPRNRGQVLHHPKHAEVIAKRAKSVGVEVETYLKVEEGRQETGRHGDSPAARGGSQERRAETALPADKVGKAEGDEGANAKVVDFLLRHLGVRAGK